ncbi:neprilysin-1-like [Ornithodoros turicata]|uniref:neprilysin-1-like n=1 Tax=Ornithodoros turicata TaxID=34597 RepID=UPI003139B0D3
MLQPNSQVNDTSTETSTVHSRHPCFLTVFYITAIISVLALLYWIQMRSLQRPPTSNATCSSRDCNYYASLLIESIDNSIDPCDDFYGYVCKRWRRTSVSQSTSVLDSLRSRAMKALLNRAFKENTSTVGQSAAQKAMTLLRTCVSVWRDGVNAVPPVKEFLADIGLPWPGSAGKSFIDIFVEVSLNWDLPSWISLRLNNFIRDTKGRPRIEFGECPYVDEWVERRTRMQQAKQYEEFVERHAAAFGVSDGMSVRHVVGMVFEVERLILDRIVTLNSHMPSVAKFNFSDLRGGEALLSALHARVPWIRAQYHQNDTVSVFNRNLVDTVLGVFLNDSSDEQYTHLISVGLGWMLVEVLSKFASSDLASLQHLGRGGEGYDYETECFNEVAYRMGMALSMLTVCKQKPRHTMKGIARITDRIVSALNGTVMRSNTLDQSSKQTAALIFNNVYKTLFFASRFQSEDEVNEMFSTVPDMIHTHFIGNWVDARKALRLISFATSPVIPAFPGILFEPECDPDGFTYFPLYSRQLVPAVNYGGIGYEIAKAIAQTVNWEHTQWLNQVPFRDYTSRLRCLDERATKNQARTGSPHHQLSVWELMTSTWTLESVFEAFKDDVTDIPSRLAAAPEFSEGQLFFLSICYNLCSVEDAQAAALLCNAPLQNMPEFAVAFQCRHNSYMNPSSRCHSW